MVITGPNAGGKSTSIKSVCISLILGQTIGVVPCKSATITPFDFINTYLNIPDCKGKESLFEAEMHRARDHIYSLDKLDKNKKSFVIMDEIFSSTNPEEGISGGYAIANKLSSYDNSVALITTHFNYLTKLEKEGRYRNIRIPITRDEKGAIAYPYKIEKGISDQFIALELLKEKGFDKELVENAMDICKSLECKNKKESPPIKPKSPTKKEETATQTSTEKEDPPESDQES